MGKYCDLHTHSTYSDGTYTPAEIIDEAILAGLSAVALCDHNSVDGLYEFKKYAEEKQIEAVAGIEISAEYNGIEVHILGLFIPEDSYSNIKRLLDGVVREKEESNRRLITSLKRAGYDVSYSDITEKYPNAKINRSHVAALLTEKGYTSSVNEAMKGILSQKSGYYVPPKRLSAMECIDFIAGIGAIAVLAHPFLNLGYEELRKFLPEAIRHGLRGIECEYSEYNSETTVQAYALADEFDILPSGGSDFHGTSKPAIKLGTGKGNLKVPYEWAIEMKNRAST